MTADPWERATFAGTEHAQAERIARLTPDQRLRLLEELLAVAASSGALQRSREDKQRALDDAWGSPSAPSPAAGCTAAPGS